MKKPNLKIRTINQQDLTRIVKNFVEKNSISRFESIRKLEMAVRSLNLQRAP